MIDGLIRLIPSSIVPGLFGAGAWFGASYLWIAPVLFERMHLPYVREQTATAITLAQALENTSATPARVSAYFQCVYAQGMNDKNVRWDFSLYVATLGLWRGDAIANADGSKLAQIVRQSVESKVCGEAPWTSQS